MLLLSSHSTEKGSHYLMILLHEETSRQSLLTNPVLHNNMCIPQHGTLRSQCRQRWCGDKVGFANTLLNLDEYKIFNYYSPPPILWCGKEKLLDIPGTRALVSLPKGISDLTDQINSHDPDLTEQHFTMPLTTPPPSPFATNPIPTCPQML